MGVVFNIQKFCIHDGDGIRTCVFFKGCPLRCIWCHNPESYEKSPTLSFDKQKCSLCGRCIEECSARIIENNSLKIDRQTCLSCGKCTSICLNDANEIIGREMTASEVLEEVLKDKIFYDFSGGGVTLTGGEPSYQPDFALELLHLLKREGISVAIETCGSGSRKFYKEAAELGVTFLFDIKCVDSVLHKRLTASDNSKIMSNLIYLMESGADIIIRLPMIPDCNDSDESIAMLSDFLDKNKGRYRYAELMPYHTLGVGKAEKTDSTVTYTHGNVGEKEISRWKSLFASYGVDVKVSE